MMDHQVFPALCQGSLVKQAKKSRPTEQSASFGPSDQQHRTRLMRGNKVMQEGNHQQTQMHWGRRGTSQMGEHCVYLRAFFSQEGHEFPHAVLRIHLKSIRRKKADTQCLLFTKMCFLHTREMLGQWFQYHLETCPLFPGCCFEA